MGTLFIASYYGDGTLLTQFLRQGGAGDNEALFEFLWRDPQLAARPLDREHREGWKLHAE